ncbi:hypothetical protein D3C76_1760720 [compost metagenome]
MHADVPVLGQGAGLGEADDIQPAETRQALGRQLHAKWAKYPRPDEGKQEANGARQVGIDEGQEVRVVGALDTDER